MCTVYQEHQLSYECYQTSSTKVYRTHYLQNKGNCPIEEEEYIDLARAKSEALDNIYNLLKQNIKYCKAKGDVTRDDLQQRFFTQHIIATLLQSCSNIVTLCCAKNRRCESSRVTSP